MECRYDSIFLEAVVGVVFEEQFCIVALLAILQIKNTEIVHFTVQKLKDQNENERTK